MKDSNLILSVLEHVRYNVLTRSNLSVSDYDTSCDIYKMIDSVNEASNLLSSLIDVLKVSEQCLK